jgi:Viral A-type inclusion protein repeat
LTPSEPEQGGEDLQAEMERLRNRVRDLEAKLKERADTRRR